MRLPSAASHVAVLHVAVPLAFLLFSPAGAAAQESTPAELAAEAPDPDQAPINVLLIYADDQRADTIGALGNDGIRTPHLDSLVERGTAFERTYCLGGPHGAVCIPSRAMLMTGRAWFELDLGEFDGRTTLPEHMAAAGYRTFMTGKWHNGHAALRRAFPQARAVMRAGMSNHFQVPLVDVEGGEFQNVRQGEGHSSEIFADQAVAFLERAAEGEAPFFCYVAFTAPHDPRDAPIAWRERMAGRRPPLPANFMPQHPFDNSQLTTRDEMLGPWPRTEELVREQLAEYYALIEHLDSQVGRVLAALEASGRADRTLVVYAADHGLAMGSHGLLGKQSVYEHSMRAPLILAGPGIPHGRTNSLAYLHDIYATVLATAGLEAEGDTHSRDLHPLLGEDAPVGREVVLTSQHHMRAITDGRWKLIRYPDIDRTQLFDLESDPAELHDLGSDPDQSERIAALRKQLLAQQTLLGDHQPWTSPEQHPAEIDLTGHERVIDPWQPQWIREKYFGEGR
ncbi:sulfatase-like hydrolase/transferase [Engelhardtia mirabilis]|uniref:Arylsulfatase n=1 Tax=Engelhardtia mirabilis TaxID=2528011 RepID=A0A518BEQ0_9BACT|nr:Arylsulfatase precursor [Planctomycetes bacterium Pla133]QDU99784.1 Arylsulfatase precursor [Planctomycetes bacterium Pla86]